MTGAVGRVAGPGGALGAMLFGVAVDRFTRWWSVESGPPEYQFGVGWSVLCSSDPANFPLEQNFKAGVNPGALVGSTNVSGAVCTVSAANTANSPYGVAIPAGATYFQAVQSTQTLPNRNGRVFMRASFPGGSPSPVPYVPGRVVLPVPDDMPWAEPQAQPQPSRGGRGRYVMPYETEAHTVVLTRPRDDGSEREETRPRGRPRPGEAPAPVPGSGGGAVRTDDPVTELPPPPGERETKARTNLGRAAKNLGDAYGQLTEVGDIVKCLEKQLPRGHPCRRKGRGLHERIDCVVRHRNDIDMVGAAACIAAEQVQDAVIGRASKKASRSLRENPYSPKRPYPFGPLSGGWGARMR